MRAKGLEPSRFWHWLLRPTCLPFHHARHKNIITKIQKKFKNKKARQIAGLNIYSFILTGILILLNHIGINLSCSSCWLLLYFLCLETKQALAFLATTSFGSSPIPFNSGKTGEHKSEYFIQKPILSQQKHRCGF